MKKKIFSILMVMVFLCTVLCAEEVVTSDLQQRAESEYAKASYINARSLYIRAFEDYAAKGQTMQGVQCGVKAVSLYYRENLYQEAFDLLRRIEGQIAASQQPVSVQSTMRYYTVNERLQMYLKMRRPDSCKDQLATMTQLANASSDETVKNDLLYQKAIYHYSFGQTAEGNAVFKEMAAKLTAQKEYDKVEDVYKTLITNGRRSNSASLVAQAYSNYMVWKDSVNALKSADEIAALKQQIADNEATIADQDSSLTTRKVVITSLCVLLAALAGALVVGALILLRFILLTRKQKNIIQLANENNALKAKFISNISSQLDPTLRKLDAKNPEVKALLDFSAHIQTLSELENSTEEIQLEDTPVTPFCEQLMDQIRDQVKTGVTLTVNTPKMSALIHPEYVSHILLHLLKNAAEYTPEGGNIWLDFKKRGAHSFQFLVSDTGSGIPEEKRDDIFKPFLEIRDLTKGDGLGLPTCKQMALKMNGDLNIDPQFTKGTRFVLDLHDNAKLF